MRSLSQVSSATRSAATLKTLTDDGECGDGWDGICRVVFTDIALAEKAPPGGVKKW